MMLVTEQGDSLKEVKDLSRNAGGRTEVARELDFKRSNPMYKYFIKRLENSKPNRVALSPAFESLAGPVAPVVANRHRAMTRNERTKMNAANKRLSKR